jgi:hypothetical protein
MVRCVTGTYVGGTERQAPSSWRVVVLQLPFWLFPLSLTPPQGPPYHLSDTIFLFHLRFQVLETLLHPVMEGPQIVWYPFLMDLNSSSEEGDLKTKMVKEFIQEPQTEEIGELQPWRLLWRGRMTSSCPCLLGKVSQPTSLKATCSGKSPCLLCRIFQWAEFRDQRRTASSYSTEANCAFAVAQES